MMKEKKEKVGMQRKKRRRRIVFTSLNPQIVLKKTQTGVSANLKPDQATKVVQPSWTRNVFEKVEDPTPALVNSV